MVRGKGGGVEEGPRLADPTGTWGGVGGGGGVMFQVHSANSQLQGS